MNRRTLPPCLLALSLAACSEQPAEHGHSHGDASHSDASHSDASHSDASHSDASHSDHSAEAGETIAVTRWTDSHELFVELDAPVAGQAFAYHAHVTHLADDHLAQDRPASSGVLTIRFEQDGFTVESHTDDTIARPGIFAAQAAPPSKPGAYQLVFSYADGDERTEWDAGEVQVGDGVALPHEGQAEGEIAFLKESQWQVPFAVAPARERSLASLIEAAGVVRTAPASTAVVAAPVEGLVAWVDELPVVGRSVTRGERLATLVPAGATEHWATLRAELTTARIDRDLAAADLARVEALGPNALVSRKRIAEATGSLARAEARVEAAERRVSALTSGGAGAVSIRAPADGVVVEVGAGHGEAVGAGAPLVKVSAGPGVLIEGRVHTRSTAVLEPVSTLHTQRGDWAAPIDLLAVGATVLSRQLVYDPATLSAPVTVLVPVDVGLSPGDLVELSLGVGQAAPRVAVPRESVVEINGQDIVFVQVSGESFSRRRVSLGTGDATHVEVTSGLDAGEMVVVQGGFDVHVASLTGALESHRH